MGAIGEKHGFFRPAGPGARRGRLENAVSLAIGLLGTENAASVDNMVFHPEAIGMAFVDLPLPRGVHMASRVQDKEMGMAFTFIQDFRADTYDYISRVDVLWGVVLQRPEMAVIVKG